MSWPDILLCFVTPAVVLFALWKWGERGPGNEHVHEQDPGEREQGTGREQDPGDLARAA